MKRFFWILLILCAAVVHQAPARADHEKLFLVRDGRPVSTIVVPDKMLPSTKQAVQWLQEYVHSVSNVKLQSVPESQAPAGTLISVGPTQLAADAGIDTKGLKYDGCQLVVRKNVLFLIGRDQLQEVNGNPQLGPRGTCRAVLTFLEDACGIRWFLPTPQGVLLPKSTNISVANNLSKTFVPAFAYSDGRWTYGAGTPASIINNFRNGVAILPGGHTYYHCVSESTYFEKHPEYFALIDGKRTGKGNHLCTTNPDVQKLITRWIQDKFDAGFEIVSLGQEDGFRRCECKTCEAQDDYRYENLGIGWDDFLYGALRNQPCERLFLLHKSIIDTVKQSHPDKKVLLMCYAPTAWPSKRIDYFGDNVIGELTNQEPKFLKAWSGKLSGMTGYVYWFNIQLNIGMDIHFTPNEVADRIRYLHQSGFIGLYQFAEANWGLQGPIFYMLGKLMGNPSLDHQELVTEYCHGVYGKAGSTMNQFFDLIYSRHEAVLPINENEFAQRYNLMPRWLDNITMYELLYPPNHLNELEGLLVKAEQEADTEMARGWLRHTREFFDFTKFIAHALISYRAWQVEESPENWLELKERVETFNGYRMKILTYSREHTDLWFPGWDHFCNFLTANNENERLYYVPWEKRKAEAMERGLDGIAIGYGGRFGYGYIKEPLTFDFSTSK